MNKRYRVKAQRRRKEPGTYEANILNRLVRVTIEGFEIEADPKHTVLIIEQMTQWDGGRRRTKR